MAHEPNTTTDETTTTTLNGTELTDLASVKEALSYLNADYTGDAALHEAEAGECLIVISRTRRFQHYQLLDSVDFLSLSPSALPTEDGDAVLKVAIREAEQ